MSNLEFDHALNDDIIRLSELAIALLRLDAMADMGLDVMKVEKSLSEEIRQLRERIEARARDLPD